MAQYSKTLKQADRIIENTTEFRQPNTRRSPDLVGPSRDRFVRQNPYNTTVIIRTGYFQLRIKRP